MTDYDSSTPSPSGRQIGKKLICMLKANVGWPTGMRAMDGQAEEAENKNASVSNLLTPALSVKDRVKLGER
jgi:hypothetical protein